MSGYSPHSKTNKVTDDEFIKAWRAHNGHVLSVGSACGLQQRGVLGRRRSIERRLGITLNAQKTAVEAVIRYHKARINITVEDGVLPIAGDIHIWPGERTTVQRAYIEMVKRLKPKYVILIGDVFDGARISRYPRIGFLENRPLVKDELRAVDEYLTEIENASQPGAKLIWCLGNHDQRYEAYLASNASEMEGVDGMHLKDRFPRWLPCWTVHINEGESGHTAVKHRYHNGIHATYNNVLKGGVNFVTGHLHQLTASKWTDYRGTRYGVDTGVMADVDDPQFINYREDSPANWSSGFAVLTFKNGKLMRPEFVQKWDEESVEFRGDLISV